MWLRLQVNLLARQTHEVWARDKIEEGWKYAPDRPLGRRGKDAAAAPPATQTSPLLVPYEFLTEKEKASSIMSATEMVRCILYLNYRFEFVPSERRTSTGGRVCGSPYLWQSLTVLRRVLPSLPSACMICVGDIVCVRLCLLWFVIRVISLPFARVPTQHNACPPSATTRRRPRRRCP